MENKITDNEIIKALECCSEHVRNCAECPLNVTSLDHCSTRLAQNVLNLINRQKAEVEKLCTEIDDLIIAKDLLFDEAEALIKKAKSKAIEQFAERLLNEYSTMSLNSQISIDALGCDIKRIAKETLGE